MTEEELNNRLNKIREGMKMIDAIVRVTNHEDGSAKINKRQVNFVRELINLFQEMSWQIALNKCTKTTIDHSSAIKDVGCGTPVKIRPCGDEYHGKTYFGILIGEVSQSISISLNDDTLNAMHSSYMPAIYVPELGKIIYGHESWWGKIKNMEDLKDLITDEKIESVWYVQLLKEIVGKKQTEQSEEPDDEDDMDVL